MPSSRSFRGGQMRPLDTGAYPGGAYPSKQSGGGALGGMLSPGSYQKGGDGKSTGRPHGMPGGSAMFGGRRKRKSSRKGKRGGNFISGAIVPFGLLGLQQCFGKRKSSKRGRSTRRRFTQKRR